MSNPYDQGPTEGYPQYPQQYPPSQPSQPQYPQYPQYPMQPQYPPTQPPYPYPTQPSYPQYPPQQPPTPPQRQNRFTPRNIAIGCGALLVACIVISGVAAALGLGSNSAANTSATATAAATSTPAATRDPNAGWQDYVSVVTPDLDLLATDLGAIGTDCSKSDLTACDNAAKKLSNDAHTAQHDLDTHPAPLCLKAVDTQLRSIYSLLEKAGTEASNGIEQSDASLLQAATHDIQTATTQMQQATTALGSVTCA
jgi:hypothetical protein